MLQVNTCLAYTGSLKMNSKNILGNNIFVTCLQDTSTGHVMYK
jgi:hypothetical protein